MRMLWRRWRYLLLRLTNSHNFPIVALLVVAAMILGIVFITHDSLAVCLLLILPVLMLSWFSGWIAGVCAGVCAAAITAPYHGGISLVSPPMDFMVWLYLSLCYVILGALIGLQGTFIRRRQLKLYAEIEAKLHHAQASSRRYEQLLDEMTQGQQQLNRMNSELALLNTIATTVNGSLDLQQVQSTAMTHISALLQTDEIHFYWLNPNGDGFVLQATSPSRENLAGTPMVYPLQGILGRIAQRQQVEFISEDIGDLHVNLPAMNPAIKYVMAVPLLSRTRLIGVLVLGKVQGEPFTIDDGRFIESVGRVLAIAVENANLFRQAQELSLSDELTGLANRRLLNLRLHSEVARVANSGDPLCMAMFDIDFFKRVNDEYGHQVGDEILAAFAKRVQNEIRSVDLFCRMGGEEFALVAINSPLISTRNIVERICQCTAQLPFTLANGRQISITVSAGIAQLQPGINTSEELVAAADKALYAAKAAGRNCTFVYTPELAKAEAVEVEVAPSDLR